MTIFRPFFLGVIVLLVIFCRRKIDKAPSIHEKSGDEFGVLFYTRPSFHLRSISYANVPNNFLCCCRRNQNYHLFFRQRKMKKLLWSSNTLREKEGTKSALSYTRAPPLPEAASRMRFRFGVRPSSIFNPKTQTAKISKQKRIDLKFERRLERNFRSPL